ncbi:hypothetical protein CLV62_10747 [Dysgonomonas alginatilytica]|uniref:DUF6249 domain-containing protein n=1 Tax=Dysgonomonas alginatilytica TaxID=1605892 RepID=A0A2V3PX87_9BACT|nr:DUF6249 domain-containing protein [Dysgonomonas alginatilytica]PXV65455.1 hypothetical protein CLV62_10747 [Dysgonomonas alginatilytica]
MDFIEEGLIPIIAILSAVALPIGFGMYLGLIALRTKSKENLELIKQGIVPPPKSKPTPNRYRSLRNGFLCVGIALGLILGNIAVETFHTLEDIYIMIAFVLLFLGLAYILFYFVTKDKDLEG